MPWGDRRGPEGMGPRTGRGLGYCSGYSSPGYTRRFGMGMGRGFGRGRGGGRGFGRGWRGGGDYTPRYNYDPLIGAPYPNTYMENTVEDERAYLSEVIVDLETQIKTIKNRIMEIEKNNKK